MNSFLAALQFLTVFPIPARLATKLNGLGILENSSRWFPAVGLILGCLCAAVDWALLHIFPQPVTSVVVVIALSYASGGLHMDGLADTADGFMSARPKERILEIMRDSRSGPMGVLALISVFSIKLMALSSLQGEVRMAALILAPALGRLSALYLLSRLQYARKEGGLATVFLGKNLGYAVAVNGIALSLIAAGLMGVPGLMWVLSALVGTEIFARMCQRKIQGFTGDTLGASCESIEALCWVAASATGRLLI
jgi:adenosylcobinamide-GDP ribazoletransferase